MQVLFCPVPGAGPSTGPITARLMIWVVVAVNLCVCDKRRIILSHKGFAGALGPTAEPVSLPEVKPALESPVVVGEGWRGHSHACYRCACAAPAALPSFGQSLTFGLDPRGAAHPCLGHVWICLCWACLSLLPARAGGCWLPWQAVFSSQLKQKWLIRIRVQWQRLKYRTGPSTLKVFGLWLYSLYSVAV